LFNGDTLVSTIDQQLASGVATGTAQTHFIHPDHLGSTDVITDSTGAVSQTLSYYPYGALRMSSGTSANEKRQFIGQFTDDSGLSYLNARYYNPNQGQFLSEEPIFLALGDTNQVSQLSQRSQQAYLSDPQQLNSYSYSKDNPITNKDTNGKLVELISRPIDGPLGTVGAHTFLYVIPDNPKTIGSIPGVDTSKPFTLSAVPQNGQLETTANYSTDYFYATCGRVCPAGASITVAPPSGVSSAQFDSNVVTSYNNTPSSLGNYFFMGWPRAFGTPNSNNGAKTFLNGAGVGQNQVYQYKDSMMFNPSSTVRITK
jgi:RHS repeat-associated protein